MHNLVTVLYQLICALLFYTCFCRLVRTNHHTYPSVRIAFVGLLSVTLLCGALPFYTDFKPSVYDLPMPAAILLVQALTAKHWREGVPAHFQRCECDH